MAQRLRTFDFKRQSVLSDHDDKRNYPWDKWLDGDIWQLDEGEDFATHPLMMERIIRTRAVTRGAKVRMRHVGRNGDTFGSIVLQRTDIVGPGEAKKAEAAAKRQAKKDAAEKDAAETLAKAGITPTKKVAAKKVGKSPSKIPAKRPVKQVA